MLLWDTEVMMAEVIISARKAMADNYRYGEYTLTAPRSAARFIGIERICDELRGIGFEVDSFEGIGIVNFHIQWVIHEEK